MMSVDRKVKIFVVALGSVAAVVALYLYKRKIDRVYQYKHAIKKLLTEPGPDSIVKISTIRYDIASKGVPFHIYLLEKPIPTTPGDSLQFDPFWPPFEEGLYLTELGNYRVIYNKYCVESKHILLITKDLQHQEDSLTEADFKITLKLMKDINGFAFYNSGPNSGHSQPHKHLQLIPFISFPHVPIEPIVNSHMGESDIFRIPEYPFKHLFHRLSNTKSSTVKQAYDTLMNQLQVQESYNLVLTENWMLLISRSRNISLERYDINSLAYAGLIFIKKQEDFEFMKKVGPIEILKDGSYPL